MEDKQPGATKTEPTGAQRAISFARELFQTDDLAQKAMRRSFDSMVRTVESIGVYTGMIADRNGRARGIDPAVEADRGFLRRDDKVQNLFRRSFDRIVMLAENVAIKTGAITDRPYHVGDGFHVAPNGRFDPRDPADVRSAGQLAAKVKPVLDAAVARFEKAPASEVLEMLGSPADRANGVKIAASGPARRNQIRQMTLAAFADERLDPAVSKHSAGFVEVAKEHMRHPLRAAELMSSGLNVHDANRQFTDAAIDRVAYLMEGGKTRDDRIAAETNDLLKAPDFSEAINDRFSGLPRSDLHGLPKRQEDRRSWVEDHLRTEAEMLSKGLMNPHDVMRAASAIRGTIPESGRGTSIQMPGMEVQTGKNTVQDRENSARMGRMSDTALRHRFREIPGIEQAIIHTRETQREVWIMKALAMERTRETMKQNGIVTISHPDAQRPGVPGQDIGKGIEVGTPKRERPTPSMQAAIAASQGRSMA